MIMMPDEKRGAAGLPPQQQRTYSQRIINYGLVAIYKYYCNLCTNLQHYRHNVAEILPVKIDLVDVWLQRQIERECVVIDDAIFDVIQFTWNTYTGVQ